MSGRVPPSDCACVYPSSHVRSVCTVGAEDVLVETVEERRKPLRQQVSGVCTTACVLTVRICCGLTFLLRESLTLLYVLPMRPQAAEVRLLQLVVAPVTRTCEAHAELSPHIQ